MNPARNQPCYQSLQFNSPIPTLNEYVKVERAHRLAAASLKKRTEAHLIEELLQQGAAPMSDGPVSVSLHWTRHNRRVDPANIAAGAKFVLDALVTGGILRGDKWADITTISHTFQHNPDLKAPYLTATLAYA